MGVLSILPAKKVLERRLKIAIEELAESNSKKPIYANNTAFDRFDVPLNRLEWLKPGRSQLQHIVERLIHRHTASNDAASI